MMTFSLEMTITWIIQTGPPLCTWNLGESMVDKDSSLYKTYEVFWWADALVHHATRKVSGA